MEHGYPVNTCEAFRVADSTAWPIHVCIVCLSEVATAQLFSHMRSLHPSHFNSHRDADSLNRFLAVQAKIIGLLLLSALILGVPLSVLNLVFVFPRPQIVLACSVSC